MRAVLLTLFAIVGLAGPAAAQESTPWTVGTAANDFGAGRDNYSYAATPGDRLEDGLVVTNPGPAPLELAVYSADAFTTGAGQLDLATREAKPTGVGSWVHTGLSQLTVQPGQSASVPFTIDIPADAPPGDHLGGIVTSLKQGDVERRVGLRIQLRVGGQLSPGVSLEGLKVEYSGGGDATLTYTIHNTGNAVLAARQTASVSGPFGIWRVPAEQLADSPQLLPGETWKTSVPVHGVVPAVSLTGAVSLVPLLPDASGSIAPLSPVETMADGWAVPWVPVGVLVVVGGLVVLLIVRRRVGAKISG
ncbi:DUF916 domain-containing protein [Amycolatopsis sp. NPDC048633]|uniref:COG1470 family protein n=1 Tax=Amycolatopsis sp. NPDC048633 TaxID=3157095 RepID=UPI0033DD6EEC